MDADSEKLKEMFLREYTLKMQAEGYYPGSRVPNTTPPTGLATASSTDDQNDTSSACLTSVIAPAFPEICRNPKIQPTYHRALASDEIRLLKISPNTDEEVLECTTLYEKLNSPPIYLALSYAWGYVDVSHTVRVDGQDCLVSRSVYTALHSLRRQAIFDACDRTVWIDALCINQDDLDEKTQQVRMMAKIYKHATLVVAWLGEMTHNNRRGFNLIAQISDKMQLHNIYAHGAPQIEVEQLTDTTGLAEQIGIPYVGHRYWEDVQSVFDKPWWSRVWVIQELLHAQQFIFLCGDTLFESEELFDFAGNFVKYPFLNAAMYGPRGKSKGVTCACSLAQWRQLWIEEYRMNMTTCLIKAGLSEATDPRDKIFALVSLCLDLGEDFIDYKKDLRQVLIKLAWYHISTEAPRMDILSMAQTFHRPDGVPGWVPCWSEEGGAGPIGLAFIGFSAGMQKIKIPPRPEVYLDEEDALVIDAQNFDTIVAILDAKIDSQMPPVPVAAQRILGNPEFHKWFCAMYENDFQSRTLDLELAEVTECLGSYPTGQPIEEVYWRSKIMDDQHIFDPSVLQAYLDLNREAMEEIIPQNIYTEMELYERYEKRGLQFYGEDLKLGVLHEDQERDYQMKEVAVSEYSENAKLTYKRKYSITEKGYVAWVPEGTEIGDGLHIVAGARVPYLLRALDERDLNGIEAVKLVGDAYVHGLMTGTGIYEMGILKESRKVRIL